MSILFCNKSVSGLTPIQNTLLTNSIKIKDECKYHINYQTLANFGWIVDRKLIPEIGHELNELIRLKIIKTFEYLLSIEFGGPEIILYCSCDDE